MLGCKKQRNGSVPDYLVLNCYTYNLLNECVMDILLSELSHKEIRIFMGMVIVTTQNDNSDTLYIKFAKEEK